MKFAYFVIQTETDEEGNFIPCIVVEGEIGYHKTDWQWGKNWNLANKICDEMNEKIGISKKDAILIQLSSMRG